MINPFTHRRVLKHGTPGRATIVAASVPARGASMFNMAMTLQVYVEGRSPYEVEGQWMVKASDTEALSGSIPAVLASLRWVLTRRSDASSVIRRASAP